MNTKPEPGSPLTSDDWREIKLLERQLEDTARLSGTWAVSRTNHGEVGYRSRMDDAARDAERALRALRKLIMKLSP